MFVLIFAVPSSSWAEVVLSDSFTDTTMVDMSKTTATVDLTEHCVRLPERSLVNALALQKDSTGYAVATSTGIKMYDYDDATNSLVENTAFSVPWATDATGVSLRQDNLNIWAITESSLAYYKFNGAGMSDDPNLKISGLNNVLSVAALQNQNSALVLQEKNGKAQITSYRDTGSLDPSATFQLDIADPVAVSIVNDSPDFILTSKTAQYYFMYDDATGNYLEDAAKRLSSLSEVVSSSSNEIGSVIVSKTNSSFYMHDDAGPPKAVAIYSTGPVDKPVAVSVRPEQYEYAYLDEDGNVSYYLYDEASGKMVRDSVMETSGHSLNKGYAHPREYYSKTIISSKTYDAVMLTVSQTVPANTSVNWFVSSDGGVTWVPSNPGVWTAVTAGDRFTVKAVLDTSDTAVTPKIFQVVLTVEDDFQIIGEINPNPAERGRNCEITAGVTRLTTGETVAVDSVDVIVPTSNIAPGGSAISGSMTYNPGDSKWHYTFLVPDLIQAGFWPDDGSYQAKITARKGLTEKEVLVNFQVQGHILRRLVIRTTSW